MKRTKLLLPEVRTVRRAAPLSMRKTEKAELDGYLSQLFSPPTAAIKHRKWPVSWVCSFQSNIHRLFFVCRETKFQIY